MPRELQPGDPLSIDHLAQVSNALYNATEPEKRDDPMVIEIDGVDSHVKDVTYENGRLVLTTTPIE